MSVAHLFVYEMVHEWLFQRSRQQVHRVKFGVNVGRFLRGIFDVLGYSVQDFVRHIAVLEKVRD